MAQNFLSQSRRTGVDRPVVRSSGQLHGCVFSGFAVLVAVISGVGAGACSFRDLSDLEGGIVDDDENATGGATGLGGLGGNGPGGDGDGAGGGSLDVPSAYSRTIVCDGSAQDWALLENRFDTNNGSFEFWVSWDKDHVYFLAEGPDFSVAGSKRFWIYGGDGSVNGTTTGVTVSGSVVSTPQFEFSAQRYIEMTMTGSAAALYQSNGSKVKDLDEGEFSINDSGELAGEPSEPFVEICLLKSELFGSSSQQLVTSYYANEVDGALYGGYPADAFANAAKGNVSFVEYMMFEMGSKALPPVPPTDYNPVAP